MEEGRVNHMSTVGFSCLWKAMMNLTHLCLDRTVAYLHRICCPSLPDHDEQEDAGCLVSVLFIYLPAQFYLFIYLVYRASKVT